MPKTPKTIVIFAMVPTLAMFVCSTFSVATSVPQQGTSSDDEADKIQHVQHLATIEPGDFVSLP